MKDFLDWLTDVPAGQWGGMDFIGTQSVTNGPAYYERGIRSKYNGPGKPLPGEDRRLKKVRKMYGRRK